MERKAAERPIDDAAWAKELERRGKLERWLNDPLGKGASTGRCLARRRRSLR